MKLTPELIGAYKKLISNPKENNLYFPALDDIIENSDNVIAKHIVFEKYLAIIKKPIPKVVFYIIADELYKQKLDPKGDIGYCVNFKID